MHQSTAIATSLILLIASLPVSAQGKRLVSSRCRNNQCWELYLLSKKVIRQDQLEGKPRIVYQVQLENKTPRGTTRRQDWVQCSLRQPFVARTDTEWSPGKVSIESLNPGGQPPNASIPSHRIYWAVCHDILQANIGNMATKARSLGYSLQLEENGREVPQSTFNP